LDIINYKRKAIWNVPYITGIYLIKREIVAAYPNIYNKNTNLDIDMRFAHNLRLENMFMHVINMNAYGYIIDNLPVPANAVTMPSPSPSFQILVPLLDINNPQWAEQCIHPLYIKLLDKIVNKDTNAIANLCSEPCPDVFTFPLFTPVFCEKLLELAESKNMWSDGRSDKVDARINNYENVPTQDVHLKQLGLETLWAHIVSKYIAPIAYERYSTYKTKNVNIAFIVKYSMTGQKELMPHHDASVYTLNVCLNKDYEGGGCRFIRQKYDLVNKDIGYATIHPGRLTHYHSGLPITSGTRYILVSFIN